MKNAFTLIELLVAISIISVLSTVGFISYQGVSSKARDSIRKDNLRSLSTSLEIYFQKNGKYVEGNGDCGDSTNFYSKIAPFVKTSVPKDPFRKDAGGNLEAYCYSSVDNGQGFRLFAKLENCSDPEVLPGATCDQFNYSLTSDGLTLALAELPTGDGTGGAVDTGGSSLPLKRVFVTSDEYMTNGSIGGITGADNICQEAAEDGGLQGEWKAWVSTLSSSPQSRPDFTKNARFALVSSTGSPTTIATSWEDLIDNDDLLQKINRDQKGRNTGPANVWTGTQKDGTSFNSTSANCNNWTSSLSSVSGYRGSTDEKDADWTQQGLLPCNSQARLYCFEQDPPVAVATNPVLTKPATTSPTSTTVTLNSSIIRSGSSFGWYKYSTTNTGNCATLSSQDYPATHASLGSGTTQVENPQVLSGLVKDTVYYFCGAAETSQGVFYGEILTFRTGIPPAPSVSTSTPTVNSAVEITLNGVVAAQGNTGTVWFNYGITNAACKDLTNKNFGSRTMLAASSNYTQPLTIAIDNTYYYCMVAQTSTGDTYYGNVVSYYNAPKPPDILTHYVTAVGSTSATFEAWRINPNGYSTTVHFRWGTSSATNCNSLPNTTTSTNVGSGTAEVTHTVNMSLTPATTYYYCGVATNANGTTYAPNIYAFSTPIPPSTAYKRVFISKADYKLGSNTPATSSFGDGAFNSLTTADQRCKEEAEKPSSDYSTNRNLSLGGNWVAWLSTSSTPAKNRIADSVYKTLDGKTVASSKADLIDGQLTNPINVLPWVVVGGSYNVWTGTNEFGVFNPGDGSTIKTDCNGWAGLSYSAGSTSFATLGFSYPGGRHYVWTKDTSINPQCISNYNSFRLYCFEQ